MPSSTDLLDANVWLALAVEAHTHHDRAKVFWEKEAAPVTAFCRITHLAFLRHLSNKAIMGQQRLTPPEAWAKGRQFLDLPEVTLLAEPAGLDKALEELCLSGNPSQNWWTDAYLAAFAKSGGLRMVTFDQGFASLGGLDVLVLKA